MNEKQIYRALFDQVHSSVPVKGEFFMKIEKDVGRKTAHLKRRAVTIAAAACLAVALCAATAFAANLFGLQDLVIRQDATSRPTAGYDGVEKTVDLISLQGWEESPEHQATAEWLAFRDSYDPDGAIIASIGNSPTGLEERYGLYFVYTPEMAEKLEEIAARYHLNLHTEIEVFDGDAALTALTGGTLLQSGNTLYSGYFYEDGSFFFEGYLPRDGAHRREDGDSIDYQFNSLRKGSMSEVFLNIGHAEDYRQWTYDTASGVPVTLAMSGYKALILVESDGTFVSVNVLMGSDAEYGALTAEELEALADSFDLSLLEQPVATPTAPTADYSACTSQPAEEIEQFASQVRQLVLNRDWTELAKRCAYPITVGEIRYETEESLAAALAMLVEDGYIDSFYLDGFAAETCREMFCNSDGVMMASGRIWFSEVLADGASAGLKITAINVS